MALDSVVVVGETHAHKSAADEAGFMRKFNSTKKVTKDPTELFEQSLVY